VKTGRKLGGGNFGAIGLAEIAARLGIPVKTARSDYFRALAKLQAVPGSLELLLECVRAAAIAKREPLRAVSAECDPEFVALWQGGGER
jgi:hypothetical protein